MKKNKQKVIIIILFVLICLVLVGMFLYLFIQSTFYKLECSREYDGMTESFVFEFDMLKNVKVRKKVITLNFKTEEGAIAFYNNNYNQNDNKEELVKLDRNKIIMEGEFEENFASKTLEEAKQTSLNWGYECKMVKK